MSASAREPASWEGYVGPDGEGNALTVGDKVLVHLGRKVEGTVEAEELVIRIPWIQVGTINTTKRENGKAG